METYQRSAVRKARRMNAKHGSKARKKAYDRIDRLLGLIHDIASGHARRASDLARRYGVSRRRIFDDLRALRRRGYRLWNDGQAYRFASDGVQLPVRLRQDEIMALLHAVHASGWSNQEVFREACARLRSALTADAARRKIDERRFDTRVPSSGAPAAILAEIHAALAGSFELEIAYESASSAHGVRRVHPHGIGFRGTGWYLVAWDVGRKDFRMFRMDRIRRATCTPRRFSPKPGFEMDRYFADCFEVWKGTRLDAVMRVRRECAAYVESEAKARGMAVRREPSGSMLLHLEYGHPSEVAWWVMRWAGGVEVLRPRELRETVARLAERVVLAHKDSPAVVHHAQDLPDRVR